jgi:chromosome segregation ATPase
LKRIESKYDALKVKDRANRDLIETLQTKLRVYESLRGEEGITGTGLGELDELEKQEIEKDVHEQLQMRLKEIEELRKENNILKISNLNELNTSILTLEQRITDANAERDAYKAKVELKESRIKTLQSELDILRGQVEQE